MERDDDLSITWLLRKPQKVAYWLPWALREHFRRRLLLEANRDLFLWPKLTIACQGLFALVLGALALGPPPGFGWSDMIFVWCIGSGVWYFCSGLMFAALHMRHPVSFQKK